MRSKFAALLATLATSVCLATAATSAEPEYKKRHVKSEVPLKDLIEFNKAELFGTGKVILDGDRIEIHLQKDGDLVTSFEGRKVMDSQHPEMKGSNRKFIQYGDQKDGEKLLPGLAAIGLGRGMWTSRFRLGGDTRVSFKIRLPNLLSRTSTLRLRINSDRGKGYETNFFNSLARVSGGRPGGSVPALVEKYRGPASKWFPRRGESIPVEVGMRDGACSVIFDGTETARLKSSRDSGGEIVFMFDKVVFTLQDVKITGKIDWEWCDKTLARLEKKKRLLEELRIPEKEKDPDERVADEAEEDL